MLLLLSLPLALAEAPITPAVPQAGPIDVDVYIDTSRSTNGRRDDDAELVEFLRSGLHDDDRLRVTGFDGTLHPILPQQAPTAIDVAAAFHDVAYTGLATFFSPIWLDVSSRAGAEDGRKHVVVVATDGTSDPLNRTSKQRPEVADPTWRDPVPSAVRDTPVIWLVRESSLEPAPLPTLTFTEGAVPARWTEPDKAESTLIFWNPPKDWQAPDADLVAWIGSLRAAPPPVNVEPPAPTVDWDFIWTTVEEGVGAVLMVAVLIVGFGFAKRVVVRKSETVANTLRDIAIDRRLHAGDRDRGELCLEPVGIEGGVIRRDIRVGDRLDIGPALSFPGIPLALPAGGVSIEIGARPDLATIRPRGTRTGVALLRRGYVVRLGADAPVEIGDGDVLIDERSETPLVRVHLSTAALARPA